jgi:pimeloyl-ACP methyl ester carboxylesterase
MDVEVSNPNTTSKEFHLLVPDLPKHGKSKEVGSIAVEQNSKLIADIIRDKAHGGKAVVVGLSYGGMIVIKLLSEFPHLIIRAIVSGTPIGPLYGTWILQKMASVLLWISHFDWNIRFKIYYSGKHFLFIRMAANQLKVPKEDYHLFQKDQMSLTTLEFIEILREVDQFRIP